MLAIKLHKTKRPNTGMRTYWIPIIDWNTAKIHISNWCTTLEHPKRGGKGVNYITMVKIPRDHPVFLKVDWAAMWGIRVKDLSFVPLNEIEQEIIDALKPLEHRLSEGLHHVAQGYLVSGDSTEVGKPTSTFPELILGAPLPKAYIKWTKDLRLLFRGDTRER